MNVLSQQMNSTLDTREAVRNYLRGLYPTKSKRANTQHPQELILHEKALERQAKGEDYKEAYIEMFLEVCTMIDQGISNPFECLSKDKIGWNSVLFNEQVEQERKDIINLQKPLDVSDGLYQCPACKSKKTHHYSRQMRSADEPMTTVITCANSDCQYRWKIN